MPPLPSISQGQMALDPVNQIIYYKTQSDELKSVTLKWLQDQDQSNLVEISDTIYIGGDLTVTGDLTINGTTTTLNVAQVYVEDNFLILNSNVTGAPITNAGIEVERGALSNVSIRWNEGTNKWEFTNNGSTYKAINEITLGDDTTGNYVEDVTAGTGISISGGTGEGSNNIVSLNAGLDNLNDVVITSATPNNFLYYNGSNWINSNITLGSNTIGNYVEDLTAGNGMSITGGTSEGSHNTVALNAVIDQLNDVSITGATPGQLLQYDGSNWINTVAPSGEPIGFENKDDSTISFDKTTRTFTISPSSSSFVVWCVGKKFVKTTSETVVIPNTSGLHYIYYDSEAKLSRKDTYFTWESQAPVSYIYWNATDQEAYFFADERHGITMDWATHEYLHRTRGAAIARGFEASNYTVTGNGSSNSDAQINIAGGTFFDEDMQIDISHSSTPSSNTWQQILQTPAKIPVFYRVNSSWKKDVATDYPFKQGTSRPQYNRYLGGTWSTVDVTNNHFGISWIVATNNLNEPIMAILGQGDYSSKDIADAGFYSDLDLTSFPVFEFRPIYKIVYECKDSFTNTVNAAFVAVDDLRAIQNISETPTIDHGTLIGLDDDDHTLYLNTTRHDAHDHSVALASAVLGDLFDVNTAGASANYILQYSGTEWLAATPTSSVGAINDLTDVNTAGATTNHVIRYTGSEWQSSTPVVSFDDLTDVTVSSVSANQIISYSGSTWQNVSNVTIPGDLTVNGNAVWHTPFNSQTSTSYTLVLSDDGKVVTTNNASPNTVTIPKNSVVAFPTGAQVTIIQLGAGQTTLAPVDSDATVRYTTTLKLRSQYSTASLLKIGTNEWIAFGDLAVL